MRRSLRGVLSLGLPVIGLAACGGGGGSGDSFVPAGVTPVPFESFSAFGPNEVTALDAGDAIQGTIRLSDDGDVASSGPFDPVVASLRLRLDDDTLVEALQLIAGDRRVTLDLADPNVEAVDDPDLGLVAITRETDSRIDLLVLADPEELGFEYQTFGIWLGGQAASNTAIFGAGAFGATTQAAQLPTDGNSRYDGRLVGIASVGDVLIEGVTADVRLDVDFAAQSIAFATTNTLGDDVPDPTLDMAGTLNVAGAGFTGSVATAGGGFAGDVDGHFYGPAAEEAAGVFDLGGANADSFTGAFGAAR